MDRLRTAIESAADFRARTHAEYPDDRRNADAIAGLKRLAETVSDVSKEQADAYAALWDTDRDDSRAHRAVELESEMLRRVGFSDSWDTADQFIAELVQQAARSVAA